MKKTVAPAARHVVSHRHDAAERQADRVADVVARGGSVTGWSLRSVSPTASVHREDKGGAPTDEEKLKEGAKKVGEAALKTPAGEKLKEKVLEDPLVKRVTKFVDTTPGKIVAGGVAAAGVGTLAATGQPLPFQPPAIPLDKVVPGLSAEVKVEGPLNNPTYVGLSFTLKEQAPAGKKGPTEKERIAADIARMRAEQQMFVPQAEKDRRRREETDQAIAYMLAQQRAGLGTSTLLPLLPSTQPKTVDAPAAPAPEKKTDDAAPVQREPASLSEAPQSSHDTSRIDEAVAADGRGLDPSIRRSMEARFGYDFSSVRLHDGPTAAAAANDISAAAFTLGDDIVLGAGHPDPTTFEGRHLLAHELAHVVQQGADGPAGAVPVVRRRSVGEWLGIFFGVEEGDWTDQELRDYLAGITKTGKYDGAFDADNKARALVRKWKAGDPGWDLTGRQKGLLIDEMIDGPTLDDDENAILDLLELSDSGDLRVIFTDPAKRWKDLDSDLDGAEHDRLVAWAAKRIKGGAKALEKGRAEITGPTLPVGAPVFAFDAARLDRRIAEGEPASEIIDLIEASAPADRAKAVDHLLHKSWPAGVDERGATRLSYIAATGDRKDELKDRLFELRDRLRTIKEVISHFFLAEIPHDAATPAERTAQAKELKDTTTPVTAADADAVREVLKPHQYDPLPEDAPPKAPKAPDADADADVDPTAPAPAAKPRTKAERAAEAKRKRAEEKARREKEDKDFGLESAWRKDVEAKTVTIIDEYYKGYVVDAAGRAPSGEIETMAPIAKKKTDEVFSSYYGGKTHPAMTFGTKKKPGNLHSWFDTYNEELHDMTRPQRRAEAQRWVLYYFQADTGIRVINDQYDADPRFDDSGAPENRAAKTLKAVAASVTKGGASKDGLNNPTTAVDKLLATKRNWGGMARGSQVFVDLDVTGDAKKDRAARWEMLQTLVHEYIHTLVSDPYEKYAKSFGSNSVEWNTLIEGVDDVFAGTVWQHIAPETGDKDLRIAVEGAADAALPAIHVRAPGHYDSYDEAMRLVQLVGIRNLTAAYFLGLVDRVRGPKKKGSS